VIASVARRTISGPDVVATFTTAFTRVGTPAAVRTDNSAVFTGAARRGGRAALEITLGAGVLMVDDLLAESRSLLGIRGRLGQANGDCGDANARNPKR
jgi:hypothetical protein